MPLRGSVSRDVAVVYAIGYHLSPWVQHSKTLIWRTFSWQILIWPILIWHILIWPILIRQILFRLIFTAPCGLQKLESHLELVEQVRRTGQRSRRQPQPTDGKSSQPEEDRLQLIR